MPFYESTFIVRPDASPQQVETLAGEMEEIVRARGGRVPKTEIWGLKSLAYRIKKNRKGHYVFMNVEASAEALGELERTLHFSDDVLRYLSVRVDALDREASPMMRNKSSRDDRSIRRDSDDEKAPVAKDAAAQPSSTQPPIAQPSSAPPAAPAAGPAAADKGEG